MGCRRPVAAILLAAGLSKRFGTEGPKQLHPFAGQPLVRHLATRLAASRAAGVIVVLGYRAAEVGEALQGLPVRRVVNESYADGQASSVVTGLAALNGDVSGALFVPCDQPLLTTEVVNSLVLAFEEGEASIVAPVFRGQRGAPTLFGREYFPQLSALTGDTGGRELLHRHRDDLRLIPLDAPDALEDADTLSELRQMEARQGTRAQS